MEALALLEKDPTFFNIIITDIEMPEMNGFEFASACRAHPKLQNLPIIAYTATLSQEVARKCTEVGMDDCIVKTDRPGLLKRVAESITQNAMKRKEIAA